jgi:hypothetical protein
MNARRYCSNPSPYEFSSEYTTILFRMLSHPPARPTAQCFGGLHSGLTVSMLNFRGVVSSHTHYFEERFWVHSLGGREVCARLFE